MLRSAAAAGCDAVFLSKDCADAWSPKVLRAAMGGHFVLSIQESADLLAVAAELKGKLLAMSLPAKTVCTIVTCAANWLSQLVMKGQDYPKICWLQPTNK